MEQAISERLPPHVVKKDSAQYRREPWARFFFFGYGIFFIVIALVGFVPDYFMPTSGNGGFPISTTGNVHGVFMAALLVLFLVQTWLVATRRVKWHRKLGMSMLVLAPACWVSMIFAARRNLFAFSPVEPYLYDLIALQLMELGLFVIFVVWGYRTRTKPESHRRIMVVLMAVLLQPGTDRMMSWLPHVPLPAFWDSNIWVYAMLAPLVIFDLLTIKRIHRTTLICLAMVFAGHFVVNIISRTPAWYEFAARMTDPLR